MKTTYFGLFPTYLLLISFKITTFLLLLSSNIGKVAELWTLDYKYCEHHQASVSPSFAALSCPVLQGVPHYCFHFVFVIFSGSRAHTEELFIAIG